MTAVPDAKPLSLADLNRATLARQMLLAREKVTPVKALERLLAIQAQWPKPPFIALWTRLAGFERSDLSALARKNVIVRGTGFRTTIFMMTAKDYAFYRATIQPTLERGIASIAGKSVPAKDHDRIIEVGRAFFEKPHTFEQLRTELESKAAKPKTKNEIIRRMAYLVRLRLPLLQVPSEADHAWGWHAACDFTLAESLLGKSTSLATGTLAGFPSPPAFVKDAQHDALVLRYLAALGPAAIADAQNFTGVTGLKAAFERLRPKLVTFKFKDDPKKELFDLPKAPRPDASVEAPVRFLPDFDNVVLGHADRRRIVDDAYKSFVYLPGLAVARTYLVDGRVAGAWKVESSKTKKKEATLVIEPFVAVSKKVKAALEEEGEALLRFHEPDANAYALRFEKPRT
jgi:hypothetical protein